MNYQDLVARTIAVKAADLEMGLPKTRRAASPVLPTAAAPSATAAIRWLSTLTASA